MKSSLKFAAAALACALALPAWCRQEVAPVRKAVEDFLRVQTKGLPGQVSFSVGSIDPNNHLPPCPALEVSQAAGARTWGRTTVTVRCAIDGGWSLFVPVQVRVVADYLVTAKPLAQGQIVGESDLARLSGDLAELPSGVLTEVQQAIGRSLTISVAGGRPLRSDMLRQATVVHQGQNVKVVSRGPGFEVANEGRALNNAGEGQVAQVRLTNGQVVSGMARAGGYVEVGF